jgi:hypothetical protein
VFPRRGIGPPGRAVGQRGHRCLHFAVDSWLAQAREPGHRTPGSYIELQKGPSRNYAN